MGKKKRVQPQKSGRSESANALLKQALANPGIRELMEVHQACQEINTVRQAVRQARMDRYISTVSSHSQPIS